MLNNFPYLKYEGQITLFKCPIETQIPNEFKEVTVCILKAFQLVNVLRALHSPVQNVSLDLPVEKILRKKIYKLLTDAASLAENEPLKKSLSDKADSFLTQDYAKAAFESSQKVLGLELMIGLLPSWRYKGKPKTYAGLLAIPDFNNSAFLETVDKMAPSIVTRICTALNVVEFESEAKLPKQVTCDIIALCGDFAAHPTHIAHFLPEDEGFYDSPTFKTLIYRNLYVSRYRQVSISIAEKIIAVKDLVQPNTDISLWNVLSVWFRGHDIGHSYFDKFCKILPGINRRQRYALQEALADLFGLQLAIKATEDTDDLTRNEVVTVYVTELIRYMTRDFNLFPDSKSAWFQFGFLIRNHVIKKVSNDSLSLDLNIICEKLVQLFNETLEKVLKGDTAYVEHVLDSYTNSVMDFNVKISGHAQEIDVDFITADKMLFDKQPTSHKVRSGVVLEIFDGRRRY